MFGHICVFSPIDTSVQALSYAACFYKHLKEWGLSKELGENLSVVM